MVGVSMLLNTSCTSMQRVSLKENHNPATRPERIEVQSAGRTYEVYSPVVRGDSLHGWNDATQTEPVNLAISDIQRARARQFSSERTGAAVVAVVLGAVVLWTAFVVVALASDGGF